MDGAEIYMPLPGDLVERVCAMVPYPQIFKVRVLSKSWLTRFSPISSLDGDGEKKQSAISFQKRVSENSDKWKTFCPVFLGMDHLVAYDRESQDWQKIPTLSFLPEDHPVKSSYPDLEIIEGALVLRCIWTDPFTHGLCTYGLWTCACEHTLQVANFLTRGWKKLPSPCDPHDLRYGETKLVSYKDRYKVILFCQFGDKYLVQTYDSHLEDWSYKEFNSMLDFETLRLGGKILNGVLYWVGFNELGPQALLAFNLKDETFEVLHMPPIDVPIKHFFLVVCNASLLLVEYVDKESQFDNVIVRKIDVELRRWVKVSEGPPYKLPPRSFYLQPVSDGDCIFFAGNDVDKFLEYNVQKDEWSDFSVPASIALQYQQDNYQLHPWSFRSGPNPFLAL